MYLQKHLLFKELYDWFCLLIKISQNKSPKKLQCIVIHVQNLHWSAIPKFKSFAGSLQTWLCVSAKINCWFMLWRHSSSRMQYGRLTLSLPLSKAKVSNTEKKKKKPSQYDMLLLHIQGCNGPPPFRMDTFYCSSAINAK